MNFLSDNEKTRAIESKTKHTQSEKSAHSNQAKALFLGYIV